MPSRGFSPRTRVNEFPSYLHTNRLSSIPRSPSAPSARSAAGTAPARINVLSTTATPRSSSTPGRATGARPRAPRPPACCRGKTEPDSRRRLEEGADFRLRRAAELLRCPQEHEPPVLHQADARPQQQPLPDVVRDEHHRLPETGD